ncbi:MAG: ral stress protein [Verrucomicrobiota bacterium]|jgi:lipopolysaccharide biosynthesis glycosyltransferase
MTDSLPPRPVLTIVSNADEKFFPGLAVAVASAVAAASGSFDYHFLILDGGLESGSLEKLGLTISRIAGQRGIRATLERLEVDQSRLQVLPERRGSRMTYAKLVLPEILSHLDSIIYLDADVLCFAGVESVHPPEGETPWLLAGARDFFSVIEKDCPWLDQVPPAERKLPYINCGVMWMNLQGLREIDFTSRSITARASIGEARQGDQSVFNFLCRGHSFILPDSINHRTAIGSSRPLCEGNLDLNLHYIGSPKPWLGAPKTSNWLAHRLWHQAQAAIFPEASPAPTAEPPHDVRTIRRKSWLYGLTNPTRAAHYRCDMRSLRDPGQVLEEGQKRWSGPTA